MDYSILKFIVFLTLVTSTFAKSIRIEDNEGSSIESISKASSGLPTSQDEPESGAKRSLMILVPSTEEDEDQCKTQKTKRCKTSSRREKVGFVSKPYRDERIPEYFLGQKPNPQLKKPAPKPLSLAETMEKAKNATFRDEDIINSLRNQLMPKDPKVGSARQSSGQGTSTIENDDFICYCTEKNNKKDADRDHVSRPQPKSKFNKKPDDVGSRHHLPHHPIHPIHPHLPHLPHKLPTPHIPHYPKHKLYPVPHRPHHIPHFSPANPRLGAKPSEEEIPKKINIPTHSIGNRPDSVVGQQAPVDQHLNRNQQTGQSLLPSNTDLAQPQEISSSNAEDDIPINNNENINHSATDENPLIPEIPNVQAVNPNMDHPSTGLGNEYETTGSGTVDYSDIKEVTAAYFTSTSDDFHISSTGRMSMDSGEDDDVNLPSPINTPSVTDSRSEGGNMLGESNPHSNDEQSNLESKSGNNNGITEFTPIGQATALIPEEPEEADTSQMNNNEEPNTEDYITESPETDNTSPLENDYGNAGPEKLDEKIDSLPHETMHPLGNDYTTTDDKYLINTDNDRVGAEKVTIPNENEGNAPKLSGIDGAEGVKDTSLPFCDNTLLQKSIKSVINNFADESEPEKTVGSPKGEDLLPEIVEVPNLKSILSVPTIERTVLDKVKHFLSRMTGMPKKNFDTNWATDVIKNNLRNIMSAAPDSNPGQPATIDEHQFKDGKWVTNAVTLEPIDEDRVPTDLERLQAQVKSLVRHPAVGLQTAKNPAVRNMILESIRHTFKAPSNNAFDDSIIRSTLNDELEKMENEGNPTMEGVESTTFDVSHIDVNKFLDIARSEAGLDTSETATTEPNFDDHVLGIGRNSVPLGLETITLRVEDFPEVPKYYSIPNLGATTRDQLQPSVQQTGNPFVGYNPIISHTENADPYEVESAQPTKDDDSAQDYTYLGKISIKDDGETDDVHSLRNSELFYIGDGVKLPLEIRKLTDGSYALSISRKICEHLLNKECPCCVPVKGNVVRTVRRSSGNGDGNRRISKRESISSSEYDSADDSIQIFSMPVETFARRYNLSLNLEKVQTPWNLDEKVDERQERNLKNTYGIDAGDDLLSVHAISENFRPLAKQRRRNNDPYEDQMIERYQRNTNDNVNKRVEIIKNMLNWLRDMVLSTTR